MAKALGEGTTSFLHGTCIFCEPWWLQLVSPDNWNVAVVERGGRIVAAAPYTYRLRLNHFRIIEMPLLTPYLGPWFQADETEYLSKRLSWEKEILTELIASLPRFASFTQNFHPSVTNWLPFYWKGFAQTTHYTYIIEDIADLERVFAGFSHAKRKNIKRAKEIVEVRTDLPPAKFYDNLMMTLAKKGKRVLYTSEFFQRFFEACYAHQAGKAFYAIDSKEIIHAAIFVVNDRRSAYYVISSIDPDFSDSGAASLLVQEAIRYYSGKVDRFDFCGHMNESIERSSREFGGKQTPYFVVSRTDSSVVNLYRAVWRLAHGGPFFGR